MKLISLSGVNILCRLPVLVLVGAAIAGWSSAERQTDAASKGRANQQDDRFDMLVRDDFFAGYIAYPILFPRATFLIFLTV